MATWRIDSKDRFYSNGWDSGSPSTSNNDFSSTVDNSSTFTQREGNDYKSILDQINKELETQEGDEKAKEKKKDQLLYNAASALAQQDTADKNADDVDMRNSIDKHLLLLQGRDENEANDFVNNAHAWDNALEAIPILGSVSNIFSTIRKGVDNDMEGAQEEAGKALGNFFLPGFGIANLAMKNDAASKQQQQYTDEGIRTGGDIRNNLGFGENFFTQAGDTLNTFNKKIGGGLDAGVDLIGEAAGAITNNQDVKNNIRNLTNANTMAMIPSIIEDIGLTALAPITGGGSIAGLVAKNAAEQARGLEKAATGVDKVSGAKLEGGEQAMTGLGAALPIALSVVPAGVGKAAKALAPKVAEKAEGTLLGDLANKIVNKETAGIDTGIKNVENQIAENEKQIAASKAALEKEQAARSLPQGKAGELTETGTTTDAIKNLEDTITAQKRAAEAQRTAEEGITKASKENAGHQTTEMTMPINENSSIARMMQNPKTEQKAVGIAKKAGWTDEEIAYAKETGHTWDKPLQENRSVETPYERRQANKPVQDASEYNKEVQKNVTEQGRNATRQQQDIRNINTKETIEIPEETALNIQELENAGISTDGRSIQEIDLLHNKFKEGYINADSFNTPAKGRKEIAKAEQERLKNITEANQKLAEQKQALQDQAEQIATPTNATQLYGEQQILPGRGSLISRASDAISDIPGSLKNAAETIGDKAKNVINKDEAYLRATGQLDKETAKKATKEATEEKATTNFENLFNGKTANNVKAGMEQQAENITNLFDSLKNAKNEKEILNVISDPSNKKVIDELGKIAPSFNENFNTVVSNLTKGNTKEANKAIDTILKLTKKTEKGDKFADPNTLRSLYTQMDKGYKGLSTTKGPIKKVLRAGTETAKAGIPLVADMVLNGANQDDTMQNALWGGLMGGGDSSAKLGLIAPFLLAGMGKKSGSKLLSKLATQGNNNLSMRGLGRAGIGSTSSGSAMNMLRTGALMDAASNKSGNILNTNKPEDMSTNSIIEFLKSQSQQYDQNLNKIRQMIRPTAQYNSNDFNTALGRKGA